VLKKAILVTGAGRRVGFHLAKRLHENGQTVIAHYRTATAEIQVLHDLGIETIQADFDNSTAIIQFIDALKQRCDDFRAVIHNASSFARTEANLSQAAAQYEQFFNVHMMAPFLINKALEPLLISDDELGDIIHITDINAENPTVGFDIYGTTKAGLHNMMLVMAKEFAPRIKVNAVAPGPVLFTKLHSEEVIEKMLDETLLAKEGGAEPVYLAVQSLLDNPFITGVSLAVDGGRRLSKR